MNAHQIRAQRILQLHEHLSELFAKLDLAEIRKTRDLIDACGMTEQEFGRECWAAFYRAMTATDTIPPLVTNDREGEINFDDPDSPEAQAEQILIHAGFYLRMDSTPKRYVLVSKENDEPFLKGLTIGGVVDAARALAVADGSEQT